MRKRNSVLVILLLLFTAPVFADPGISIGVVYNFGSQSDLGVSLKVLSTDEEDKGAIGAGVSYFPVSKSKKYGFDLSAGYVFENGAATVGWDFLNKNPQVGIGYVNTDDDDVPAPVVVVSDRRLKKDIVYLSSLENGIRLYSFKYLWSDDTYVGVMAQDILTMPSFSHAVHLMQGSFYAVDYQALGLKMIPMSRWLESTENMLHAS